MNIVFIFVKSMFFGVPEENAGKRMEFMKKAGTEASREKIWWKLKWLQPYIQW